MGQALIKYKISIILSLILAYISGGLISTIPSFIFGFSPAGSAEWFMALGALTFLPILKLLRKFLNGGFKRLVRHEVKKGERVHTLSRRKHLPFTRNALMKKQYTRFTEEERIELYALLK